MAQKHGYAKAPGSNDKIDLSLDLLHGYRKVQEGVATKSGPNTTTSRSKHRDAIDFGVNDEIGYNVDESELQKKK